MQRIIFFSLFCLGICLMISCDLKQEPMDNNPKIMVIDNLNELKDLDGKEVIIEGIYKLHNPYPNSKGVNRNDLPVHIVLEGDETNGIFLAPFWHENARRSEAEITNLENKKVQVQGVFYKQMPENPEDKLAASLGGACLFPVNRIIHIQD